MNENNDIETLMNQMKSLVDRLENLANKQFDKQKLHPLDEVRRLMNLRGVDSQIIISSLSVSPPDEDGDVSIKAVFEDYTDRERLWVHIVLYKSPVCEPAEIVGRLQYILEARATA